jgi:hypothetical protein
MIFYQVFWQQGPFDATKNGSFVQPNEENLAKNKHIFLIISYRVKELLKNHQNLFVFCH